ncbi:MAG: dUTPase [Rhodanobacteraceae bacterium]
MNKPDKFDELFRLQKQLNHRIGVDTDLMTEAEREQWLLQYCRAMNQEIAELVDCVPWKWWAKYQTFDRQNARVEIVDLFHFLISAAQVLGLGAAEIFESYAKKHQVNLERQGSGYASKDEGDNKHI